MKTTVRRSGDGYVLNGQKTFITNGPYADVLVVYTKLDDGVTDPRDRKILTFVLDTGMPGLTQGKPFRKMGFHSSPTGELFFEDVLSRSATGSWARPRTTPAATAATAPSPGSSPNGWASPRCRSGSSRSASTNR